MIHGADFNHPVGRWHSVVYSYSFNSFNYKAIVYFLKTHFWIIVYSSRSRKKYQ